MDNPVIGRNGYRHIKADRIPTDRKGHFESAPDKIPGLELNAGIPDLLHRHGSGCHAGEENLAKAGDRVCWLTRPENHLGTGLQLDI